MKKITLAATLLGLAALVAPLAAQNIQRIEINVLSGPNQELVGTVGPGETLTLAPGEIVRLRMSAIPDRGAARYPSARFEVISGPARVMVKNQNEETGNITLQGLDVTNRAKLREPTVIRYEILGRDDVSRELRTGSIRVEIGHSGGGNEQPGGDSDFRGVMLHEETGFRGQSRDFEVAEMASFRASGLAVVNSIQVQDGCKVVLYAGPNFSGASFTTALSVDDLSRTRLGRGASSLRLDCSVRDRLASGSPIPRPERGVTLYEDSNFRGFSQTFTQDVSDMSRVARGGDWASSARIDDGCEALLYQHKDFGGDFTIVNRDFSSLSGTKVGNDATSSLTVRCN